MYIRRMRVLGSVVTKNMGRAPCCDKQGVKKGPWTREEDQKLIAYINNHGLGNWRYLPKKAGLLRCGKSCRLRWTNYLRPDIKRGHFTHEEEECIIKLHAILGNRWSTIASHLPGRTDNEIKNVWNTHLKKRLLRMGIDPTTHAPLSTTFNELDSFKMELVTNSNHSLQSQMKMEYESLGLLSNDCEGDKTIYFSNSRNQQCSSSTYTDPGEQEYSWFNHSQEKPESFPSVFEGSLDITNGYAAFENPLEYLMDSWEESIGNDSNYKDNLHVNCQGNEPILEYSFESQNMKVGNDWRVSIAHGDSTSTSVKLAEDEQDVNYWVKLLNRMGPLSIVHASP